MNWIKRGLYLILPIMLACKVSKAQKDSEKVIVSLDTVRVEGRVGVLVNFSNMPKERFVLEIPEIFMLQNFKDGLSNYSNQQWKFTNEGGSMKLTDGPYQYSIKLFKKIGKNFAGVAWEISVSNHSDSSIYDLASFNCWTMNTSPLFKDTKMERTYVNNANGEQILLKDVEKTQGGGRRNMQFYPTKDGIDLKKSAWLNRWFVSSPQILSGNKISVMAKDGTYNFENIVNGDVAFFFNNWEEDHGCVHASPIIARELQPRKTASATGIFKFVKSN